MFCARSWHPDLLSWDLPVDRDVDWWRGSHSVLNPTPKEDMSCGPTNWWWYLGEWNLMSVLISGQYITWRNSLAELLHLTTCFFCSLLNWRFFFLTHHVYKTICFYNEFVLSSANCCSNGNIFLSLFFPVQLEHKRRYNSALNGAQHRNSVLI